MEKKSIKRIDFRNQKSTLDIEIVDIQSFFESRNHQVLSKDFRLNFWVILYITDGEGFHSIDFQRYPYKKGDIVFISKNQVHHFEINPTVRGYVLHLDESFFYRVQGAQGELFLEFVDRAQGSPVLAVDPSLGSTSNQLMTLIVNEYHKPMETMSIELIVTLFQGWILSLKSQTQPGDTLIHTKEYQHFKDYRQLVEAHYITTRNVEVYAKWMGLSKKTINQSTRHVVGLSAKQYIIQRILLEMKRLLSQGTLMNYEIAEQLGFDEAANMTKFFTHYVGISPNTFKKQLKEF